MIFVKKPVQIAAVQWTGNNLYTVMKFMGTVGDLESNIDRDKFHDYENIVKERGLKIKTLEGDMSANIGDWIIRGVKGEFYPCKPDIFEETYDYVGEGRDY